MAELQVHMCGPWNGTDAGWSAAVTECWLQWKAATECNIMLPLAGRSRCAIILPPGAIQSCHLIRSGLDCQIQLSEAA